MTHANIETGEIHGCNPKSLTWWHENGHIAYSKTDNGIKNAWAMESSFIFTVIFTVIALFVNFFKYLALLFLLTTGAFLLYEEVWCWVYAVRERKRENFIK